VSANAESAKERLPHLAEKDNVQLFNGFMNSEEDRGRFVSFLKAQNLAIECLVYNQPYMLDPSSKETGAQINVDNPKIKDKRRNDERLVELKEKMRILVETPM
jgi:hypothetical protein